MYQLFQSMAILLAGLSFLASFMVIIRLKQPVSFAWWCIKVLISALAPFFIIAGIFNVLPGITIGPLWITVPGIYSALVFIIYLYRAKNVINTSTGLEQAYGPDWKNLIKPDQKALFLSNPISMIRPAGSAFTLRQDVPFGVVPGTNRELLCDIWTPAENRSGLAFIYFHGSAWGILDKDFGTRPFFKHLVSQGHVIMDVAYRLFPETDMTGMIHDVYRAIAWMKNQAADLKIKPDRIVIGGCSAGGHLSLLAAYSKKPAFIPVELQDTDLSVHAVISEYGPSDLRAMYYHTGQDITTHQEKKNKKTTPKWVQKIMGENFHRLGMDKDNSALGILPVILGCYPDQCPEVYAAFSPITHVHKDCPQTLILQGDHDLITPVAATRQLYERLKEKGVTVAMYLIPQTDHGFDLILPNISPVAHTAFYLVERFLALQVSSS